RDAFIKLVARSDVVVENFRRGVLAKLGLPYDVIKRANPDIILASISSQGETGPDSQFISFGSTLEAMGGLAWRTGYAGGAPVISGNDLNFPDQVIAIFAAGMICAAIGSVRNGGGGAHLDLSQRELTSFLSGDAFADLSAGHADGRRGNDDASYALQDCFAARDRTWVALSVHHSDIGALGACMGADVIALTDDGRLREAVGGWVGAHPHEWVVERLLAAGIAAAPVLGGPQVLQRAGQGWEFAMARLADGVLVKGFPFQLDQDPLAVAGDAARCGAHSVHVLREVGGYSLEEVHAMIRQGITESHAGEIS
ncbi:MAG: CoA transferase, partial [Burkholderiales bacterium]|nr:CoA transferase [Burkholderiales bacterium]